MDTKKHGLLLVLLLISLNLGACKAGAPKVEVVPPPMPAEGGEQWWNDRVFYEVFVRSYQDSDGDGVGDLAGLIERLDYLNDGDPKTTGDLGIGGLWLMPIAESPSYHGYDVVDYYAVDKEYGDAATFKQFVDAAHERGIMVIVDLVVNHTSNQHPWFQDADRRDWYVWSEEKLTYRGPWGQQVWYKRGDAYYYAIFWEGMPDLNYRSQEVTDEIYAVTRFWLEEMGVDGFRMDAIRHLIEDGKQQENTPETHLWLQAWHDFYKGVNPQALTVGEVWTRTEDVVPYVGEELDICFEFDLASAILSSVNGGTGSTVASVAQKADKLYPTHQYATFLTNHDHERAMTQLREDEARARSAAAIYLTLPGVPFIYYGEEIGLTGKKPDENLRTPMQWSGEDGAGFTTGTPWKGYNSDYRRRNVEAQLADEGSLLNHYKRLIRLRSAYEALRTGELVPVASSDLHVYAYLRRHGEGEDILVVHNLGAEAVNDYWLTLRTSKVAPGKYSAYDLLGEAKVELLEVGDKGSIKYAPAQTLQPGQSMVILLRE